MKSSVNAFSAFLHPNISPANWACFGNKEPVFESTLQMTHFDMASLIWRWSHTADERSAVEAAIVQERARRHLFDMRDADLDSYKLILDHFPEDARQDYLRWERLWTEVLEENDIGLERHPSSQSHEYVPAVEHIDLYRPVGSLIVLHAASGF